MRRHYKTLEDDAGDPNAADSLTDIDLEVVERAAEINLMICISICKEDQRAFNMHSGMMHQFNARTPDKISDRICVLLGSNMPIREAL